jgi:hypothetical protein
MKSFQRRVFPITCSILVTMLVCAGCKKSQSFSGGYGKCSFKIPITRGSDTGKVEYIVVATGPNSSLDQVIYTNIEKDDTILNPQAPWDWKSIVIPGSTYYHFSGTGNLATGEKMIATMVILDNSNIVRYKGLDTCR